MGKEGQKDKTLHRKLKIEQHLKPVMNSRSVAVLAPLVAQVVYNLFCVLDNIVELILCVSHLYIMTSLCLVNYSHIENTNFQSSVRKYMFTIMNLCHT